jgi:hypothetical protein
VLSDCFLPADDAQQPWGRIAFERRTFWPAMRGLMKAQGWRRPPALSLNGIRRKIEVLQGIQRNLKTFVLNGPDGGRRFKQGLR